MKIKSTKDSVALREKMEKVKANKALGSKRAVKGEMEQK